jgi:hypothetical protein
LVNGFTRPPRVELDGREIELKPPQVFEAETGRLTLQLVQPTQVSVR